MENPHLSIVIPVFNESKVIQGTIEQVLDVFEAQPYAIEIIVVDDGSSDNTPAVVESIIATHASLKLIVLSRNFGHQNALCAGLDVSQGDYVAIMDADLQDPPSVLMEMLQEAYQGYDVIFGVRALRQGNRFKKMAYWLYYRLLRYASNQPIDLDSGDFSVMSRRVVNHINKLPERNRFLRGLRSWIGFRQRGFEYVRPDRHRGTSKYNLMMLTQLATDGVLSSSRLPLKLSIFFGMGLAAIGFLWAIKVIFERVFLDNIPQGFSALMVAILVVGGTQLIAIGVLGYYLGRVLDQVEARPSYIIDKKVNF